MKSMSFDLRNRISRLFFHLALQNLILARKLTLSDAKYWR